MSDEKTEPASFSSVFEAVYPVIIRVAYHITGSMSVSEDLCQEAFLRYYNKADSLPTLEQTKYWLIRVVKNLSFNYEKRKGRERTAYEKITREPQKVQESGETVLIKNETSEIVRKTLTKLPEKLRTILILKEYSGLSYKEIAKALKITEGNVKVRVFRARTYLQDLLSKEDFYVP